MKAWVNKSSLQWFEVMQNEGRTRELIITTFPTTKDRKEEVEIDILTVEHLKEK